MAWIEVNGGQRNLAFELATANHLRTTIIHRSGDKFTEPSKRRGKFPPLATDTEVNNCLSIY